MRYLLFMNKYVFPAIITYNKDENCYYVNFPDIKNCFTDGKTLHEAIEMGADTLCLMLYDMEERGEEIPAPSEIKSVKCGADDIVTLIVCDTLEYRMFFDNKADKKTLTVPHWLNVMAERKGANFSAILQNGLKEFCGINSKQ